MAQQGEDSVVERVRAKLEAAADPSSVPDRRRFFRAEPGGYGEGDQFLGVSVPAQRRVAKSLYRDATVEGLEALLADEVHEVRLTALFMMVLRFERTREDGERRRIVELYCRRIDRVNNWDLVDSSAPHILGAHLLDHPEERGLLFDWAASGRLWRQRSAVLATFAFIRAERYEETLELARLLLDHPHDLIHKAVGWMLREVGKRAPEVEYGFLDELAPEMPRTMLRYAVEKFSEERRRDYMSR
ncbi:MAG: DNA alkylation repair protein [Spirochaetes bacterium]|jgi:3-methyladenine DNA glycosylase AlkD|nr:DNA alkylation repair protein [Spirochaetota bacterium]